MSSLFISILANTTLASSISLVFNFICILLLTPIILYFLLLDFTTSNTTIEKAKGCTVLWRIENLSYSKLKPGECVKSPVFPVASLDGTLWSLFLFPKGVKSYNSATVLLKRETDQCGPRVIQVKYQIAFLDKYGLAQEDRVPWQKGFQRENSVSFCISKRQGTSSGSERKYLLPKNTLKLQFKIWKKDEQPIVSELLSARTVFKRQHFLWKIEKFSSVQPDQGGKFVVTNKLTNEQINFRLVLRKELGFEKKLYIDIRSFYNCIKLVSLKVSIVNSKGIKVHCVKQKNVAGDLEKEILFPLSYNMLMREKSRYLPNDVLSLDCEYVSSYVTSSTQCARNRTTSYSIEEQIIKNQNAINVEREKSDLTSVLVNDLKSMYTNATLSDMELRTSTQTFPAHKAILSARSTVFRRMLSSDTKEKNTGHIDVTDFEDETVQRMLTYIYTDSLDGLQMESASKLYTAADKYDIPPLKLGCSTFLINNLCPYTACEVLVLADKHQDCDLKNAVKEYIMKHDKEVFNTPNWKLFMTTDLQLAADVMYQKVSQARIYK